MKAKKILLCAVSLVLLLLIVMRIVHVNTNVLTIPEERYAQNQWVELNGAFQEMDDENTEGYSVRILGAEQLTYNEFLEKVDAGEVESVEITDEQINIVPKSDAKENPFMPAEEITYYTGRVEDATLISHLLEKDVKINGEIPDNSGFLLSILLTYVLPFVVIIFLFNFLMKKMCW